MLLYGRSGTGKTTFWATFPGPILALICSGGKQPGELKSIDTPDYRQKINPVIVSSVADCSALIADAGRYETVVLDHASGLADLALKEALGLDELPAQKSWGMASQQQYGQSSLQTKEVLRALLNTGKNVVIVAHERTFGEGSDSEIIAPVVGAALTPSVTGWLNGAVDYVVQTQIRPKTNEVTTVVGGKPIKTTQRGKGVEYVLRTAPHETYTTKFRVPKGVQLPEFVVDPDYAKILSLIRGRVK
jgi:hypothetical protein